MAMGAVAVASTVLPSPGGAAGTQYSDVQAGGPPDQSSKPNVPAPEGGSDPIGDGGPGDGNVPADPSQPGGGNQDPGGAQPSEPGGGNGQGNGDTGSGAGGGGSSDTSPGKGSGSSNGSGQGKGGDCCGKDELAHVRYLRRVVQAFAEQSAAEAA